jgi:alkanesulfonate monooxygenase SsuD/methylene tetrahydromethanopterin reductase-like flavin-dependent oxidoreductase (luciferase family)
MHFDIFFSFSKMDLGDGPPADRLLYDNLFKQIREADALGFDTAWIGEAHFSIKTEQVKPEPLLPHFKGELCINTDILQIAAKALHQTKRIGIGSAIRNILVNGGPIAHAEAIRTFLTIHGSELELSNRKLHIGFGIGRFVYANEVHGIKPRNEIERLLWPQVRNAILHEASTLFLRLLNGETLGSDHLQPTFLFRKDAPAENWEKALVSAGLDPAIESIKLAPRWKFDPVLLLPEDTNLDNLELVLGSHDPALQNHVNTICPVKVFNLSVTPSATIDATHERMQKAYHPSGGPWHRSYMPRTIMIFTCADEHLNETQQNEKAANEAREAMIAYWKAMEGTVDQKKVEEGMENAVYGSPEKVYKDLTERFHPEDRLMTWFDFNTNDAAVVIQRMRAFVNHVVPRFQS